VFSVIQSWGGRELIDGGNDYELFQMEVFETNPEIQSTRMRKPADLQCKNLRASD
jgi:hypothetical protein